MRYARFRLLRFRSPLLTESFGFIFLQVLRCFSSLGTLHQPMNSVDDTPHNPNILLNQQRKAKPLRSLLLINHKHWRSVWGCVPAFGNPRIKACSSAPRGLSQIATSFIAHLSQGIHHTLFMNTALSQFVSPPKVADLDQQLAITNLSRRSSAKRNEGGLPITLTPVKSSARRNLTG